MMAKKSIFAAALITVTAGIASCAQTPSALNKVIDSGHYDPAGFSAGEIRAAAALDVYFEHASVGDCLVGKSYGTSGLALLAAAEPRYSCGRASWNKDEAMAMTSGEAAWFDVNNGLGDNYRGNPNAAAKISYFQASLGVVAGHIDVAMFKFCFIDQSASFSAVMTAMEALETRYPDIVFVWWTMPLYNGDTSAERAQRQAYNEAVRAYCTANGKWLLDIADLECHDGSGNVYRDGSGNELLYTGYTSDGGHLEKDAGKLKLAGAYWTLLAEIAKSRG